MTARVRRFLVTPAILGMAAALLAAQFAAGTGMAHCPMHGGGGMAEMGGMPAAHHHHSGRPEGAGHTTPCSCLGACHHPTVGILPAPAPLPAVVDTIPGRTAVALIRRDLPVPPRLLPFAIGPPSLA